MLEILPLVTQGSLKKNLGQFFREHPRARVGVSKNRKTVFCNDHAEDVLVTSGNAELSSTGLCSQWDVE